MSKTKYEEIIGYDLDEMAAFIFSVIKQTVTEGPPFTTLDNDLGSLLVKQALMTKVLEETDERFAGQEKQEGDSRSRQESNRGKSDQA